MNWHQKNYFWIVSHGQIDQNTTKLNFISVVLYPVIDLEDIFRDKNDHDILQSRTWIKNVIGNHLPNEELIKRAWTLSPIHQEYGKCRVLLLHGKNDPLVDIEQSDMFFDKYKMQIKYLRFQYATHGFDALWNGLSIVFVTPIWVGHLNQGVSNSNRGHEHN